MSQAGVFVFLTSKENRRKWFSNKEIADEIGASVSSVTCNTAKLVAAGFVENKTLKFGNYTRMMFRARCKK